MSETGFTTNCHVLKEGEMLLEAGTTPDHVYKVEAGEVGVYRGGELLGTLGPGSFLGADAALTGDTLRYSVRGAAAPASWLNEYSLQDFTHAFTANQGLAELVVESLDAFVAALQRHELAKIADPTRRIAALRRQTKARADRIAELLGKG